MSLTQFGFCPNCERQRELVMTSPGSVSCHDCGAVDVFESREKYEEQV